MNIKPIRTKKDYRISLRRMEELWGAPLGTSKGDELDVLATLVDRYEDPLLHHHLHHFCFGGSNDLYIGG